MLAKDIGTKHSQIVIVLEKKRKRQFVDFPREHVLSFNDYFEILILCLQIKILFQLSFTFQIEF